MDQCSAFSSGGGAGSPAPRDRRARNVTIADLRREGWTLQEIGERFGLSRERVRQILTAAGPRDARSASARRGRRQQGIDAARALRAEILSRWSHGERLRDLAPSLGIPLRAAQLVVRESASAEDAALRRAALNVVNATFDRRYRDAELVAAVRRAADALGRAPSGREYTRLASSLELPGLATIQRRLGWSSAVRAAGLTPRVAHGGGQKWDEDTCLAAVKSVAAPLGRPPTLREYDRASRGRPELPSPVTVAHHFGGWASVRLLVAQALVADSDAGRSEQRGRPDLG
jgi:uncharacterized protein (DUF433 family)